MNCRRLWRPPSTASSTARSAAADISVRESSSTRLIAPPEDPGFALEKQQWRPTGRHCPENCATSSSRADRLRNQRARRSFPVPVSNGGNLAQWGDSLPCPQERHPSPAAYFRGNRPDRPRPSAGRDADATVARREPPRSWLATISRENMSTIRLAVNGTLMRDFRAERQSGSPPVQLSLTRRPRARTTASGPSTIDTRQWSAQVGTGRRSPSRGGRCRPLASRRILLAEPSGLCVGKVRLADGEETLGVLGEPALCEGQREITGCRRLASLPPPPGRSSDRGRGRASGPRRWGLPLEPGSAAAVAEQLAGLLASARLFAEFPLPDDVEPAPVFRP